MEQGVAYSYSSLAFPRYHYFQSRLKRLLPRWQNILDAGGLPDCISQGTKKVKEILAAAEEVADEVVVNIFADADTLKKGKFDLPEKSVDIGEVMEEKLQWTGYIKDLKIASSLQPLITVFVTQSMRKVHEQLEELTALQLKDVIIYNDQDETAVLFSDCENHDLDSKTVVPHKSLSAQVQCLLEEKAVAVLEMIASYILTFIPRPEEELDSSLLDTIHMELIQSLKNPYIVKDLSPLSHEASGERIPTDKEFEMIAEVVTPLENGAIRLGLTHLDIERIKMDTPNSIKEQSVQMLRTWRQRNGSKAMLKDLLRVLKEMKINISALEMSLVVVKSDAENDEIFRRKLTEFVCKKTRGIVCDNLSKKYGISASLINEFLNNGFFGYEAKMKELMGTISMPKWPRDKKDNGVSACSVFSYRCAMSMTKLVHNTEDYIKTKLKILIVLKKLQFELFGLLSEASVKDPISVPPLPKLPLELQYELLSLEEVTGCGTCFGELMLHVKRNLYPVRKEEIKQMLKEYNYAGGFKTELMVEKNEQVRVIPSVLEQGQELRARKVGEDEHSYGSLGCFFHLKPRKDMSGMSEAKQKQSGAMVCSGYVLQEGKDHFVTCAHCLKDCEDNVEVRNSMNEYSHIGMKKCLLYNPEAIDVATVQVYDEKLGECNSALKRSDGMSVPNWQVFELDPIRRDVHKEGCRTNFTRGLVMSTDYMTKTMTAYNVQKFRKTGSLVDKFVPTYNILIESLPGSGEQIANVLSGEPVEPFEVHPFSLEGDSGSVIIADDPNTTTSVNVVALLLGAVVRREQFLHSYASLMNRTMEEIEVQYDCIATPSRLLPQGHAAPAQGAFGGGAG